MQLRRGVGVAIVAGAVTVAAAASVSAAPASSKQVVDRTYSCKVRPARYIDLESSVTLPPENGQPRPGQVRVTTVKKGIQRNGITFYVPQVFFEEKKDSLDSTGRPAAGRRGGSRSRRLASPLRARRRRPPTRAASTAAARRRSACSCTSTSRPTRPRPEPRLLREGAGACVRPDRLPGTPRVRHCPRVRHRHQLP